MIARAWRGWVRTEQAATYVEYITGTGLSAYGKTPAIWVPRCGRQISATALSMPSEEPGPGPLDVG